MHINLSYWIKNKIKPASLCYGFFLYGMGHYKHNIFNMFIIFLKDLKYLIMTLKNHSVRLEVSSICQLKCPVCPTGKGLTKKNIIGWNYIKFKDFKKFVDDNPKIKHIELSNWGEIFLNPELKDIIKHAYQKNIILSAVNGVNLNTITEETIKCLVKYKFRHLLVSIDGASNETYRIYRQGGNFNTVIDNVKKINYYKKKFNCKYPKLSWQFVIFGHNVHELPIAEKMAKELNMKFLPKLNHTSSYSPVKNRKLVMKYSDNGITTREEFKQIYKRNYLNPCGQLWLSPQINWDGKLLGCCINMKSDFGNVFEKSLQECLKSEKYVYAKNMLLGKVKPRKDIPCYNCKFYDNPEGTKKNISIPT